MWSTLPPVVVVAEPLPCPPWCLGRPDDYEHQLDLDLTTGMFSRRHELFARAGTSVEVEERHHSDGTVTWSEPIVYNEAFPGDVTADLAAVRAVAADLLAAAEAAERVRS